MIVRGTGDILKCGAEALVNPVNSEGVMGRGLAARFKSAFPDAFVAYASACRAGEVRPGRVHVHRRSGTPSVVFHFPTKDRWKDPSRLEWIKAGLDDLASQARIMRPSSLAVPALGCGLGGLRWEDVEPLILEALGSMDGVSVVVFSPA